VGIKKRTLLFFLLHITQQCILYCTPDPFSKIVITSNKAVCQKDDTQKKLATFTYQDNVAVTFADQSSIHSDKLEIQIDTTKTTTQQKNKTEQFKKITFRNNVIAKRENRTIKANVAELYLQKKICKLIGNVQIKQIKEKEKDIPILTLCTQATLNLGTEHISFEGTVETPVSTTIELAGYPSLIKKPKQKSRKKAKIKSS
jgi:lipopolysaccharide assembly outer membrane protein LptD (OstA)